MNYLAHFCLVNPRCYPWPAVVLAECIKGDLHSRYAHPWADAIRFHRAVDRFVDTHDALAEARALFPDPYRRFCGILMDLIFDHFLARAFAEYSERPLPEFAEDVYQTLRVYPGDYTARGRRIVANMTQNRWLESYVEIEGLQPALTFLGAKLRFENPLKEALPLLRELEAPLAQAFYQFWPELIAFAREQGAFGPHL